MADALRAASARAGLPRRRSRCTWSRRARRCARGSRRRSRPTCRSPGMTRIEDVPDGPAHRRRQRVLRRAAGPPVRQGATAGASAWSASSDDGGSRFVVAPDPTRRAIAARCAMHAAGAILERRHDRLAIGALARASPAGRRGADHRLRPRATSGFGDTLQAVRRTSTPTRWPPGRGRSHRPGRFRRARARCAAAGAARARPARPGRISAPARHRAARRAAEGERHAAAGGRHRRRRCAADRAGPDGQLFKVLAIADPARPAAGI